MPTTTYAEGFRRPPTALVLQSYNNFMELLIRLYHILTLGDGDVSATPRHPTLMNTNIYPAKTSPPLLAATKSHDLEPGFSYR